MSKIIKSFTDLNAWRKSHELVIGVYKTCESIPKNDSLRNQMERCAVSITSNIAEGFGRQTTKDKSHFYTMARGSVYELQNQLLIARDTKKISEPEFRELADTTLNSIKLLHGLIRSTKKAELHANS